MTERVQHAEPPDACPKGHRIWWFSDTDIIASDRTVHYGICAGTFRRGRWPSVDGASCRYPWLWATDKPDRLDVTPQLNQELLVRVLRELAYQVGIFETGMVK